ncbi:MAG TPA: porin [Solirubrobacterales bacterium]|nr:porin [Solirubrobacterales bacterium]
MRTRALIALPVLAACFSATPVRADATAGSIQIGGFVDLYAAYNRNRPADHINFLPGANTLGSRAGELAVDFAAVEIQRDPAPVGFHLIVGAGDELTVLHPGESAASRDTFRNVYQASLSYLVPVGRGLRIEAGIYPSHIGFESALARDTWSYTGSWAANFSPYYQTGVKAAYAWSDRWSAELHVVNGWQLIRDDNGGKSVGTRVAWTSPRASVAVNGWVGPELPGDDRHLRTLIDLVATVKAGDRLDLALESYAGRQELPAATAQRWTALDLYARYRLDRTWAAALRLERFDDPDAGISGAPQRLHGVTVTLEARPHPAAILRLEARYDRSTMPVFSAADPGIRRRDQLLFIAGSIFTF